MKQLIIFDGNSILNRAFYGIRPLTTKDGQPTNAIYGFINIILKNISMLGADPDYAVVTFDMKAKTFRHLQYDKYKANRKGMPEELASQMPLARELPALLGYTMLEREGYEADDIIGTISSVCKENDVLCTIVTGDRDSFQLITDHTRVFLASANETKIYDEERINGEFGVAPIQMIDVKALMGDASDNIPGVAGIGEKTALKLIAQYGDLDSVYASVDELKGSVKEKIASGRESAYLSRSLAKICKEVPVPQDIETYAVRPVEKKKLLDFFTRLEFTKLIERFDLNASDESEINEPVQNAGFDVDIPFKKDTDKEYYVFFDKDELFITDGEENHKYSPEYIRRDPFIKEFFKDNKKICAWNRKDLFHFLYDFDILLDEEGEDVSLKAYVSGNAEQGGITPSKTISQYLMKAAETPEQITVMLPELFKVLGEEADETLYNIEKRLSNVLFEMEQIGFAVDKEAIIRYSSTLEKSIKDEENAIYDLAGCEFNINSPKQLSKVLFEDLKLPHGKKTKSTYSTDADVLEKLRRYHPIIDMILSYRQLAKLKGTYADGLLKVISEKDGRIHTTFRQTLTQTGRLSSTEPNLQNIPVRQEAGREFRKFFVSGGEDSVLIDADYSQIELRVLAHISNDKALIGAFNEGRDIHALTASQVFNVPIEAVTGDMRKKAKAVNFGIVYGISAFSLAEDIKVARWQAENYINKYFETYSGVYDYMNKVVENARKDKYVTTLFGRRRFIPELLSPKKTVQAFGERIARNTPIQGTAADIIKIAMVEVRDKLRQSGLKSRLILQVHDELIVEAPKSEAEAAASILKECMENACKLSVPLISDVKIGRTWYDTHE